MKKVFFLAILSAFTFSNQSFGQSGLGIKGGVNFNKVYTDAGSLGKNISQSLDTKTGWSFGLFGRLGKEKIFLQPEMVVAGRKGEISVTPLNGGSPVKIDAKYTNLDIPLLLGIRPVKFLRIMAGPVASLKISEDEKLKDALNGYVQSGVDNAFKNATFGYQLGLGTKLLGFEIDLRKEGSLSEISVLNATDSKFSQRASGWQLTIARKIL